MKVTASVEKGTRGRESRNDPVYKRSLANNPRLQSEAEIYHSMLTGGMVLYWRILVVVSHTGEQAAEMTKAPEVVVGKAEIAPKRHCKASTRRAPHRSARSKLALQFCGARYMISR